MLKKANGPSIANRRKTKTEIRHKNNTKQMTIVTNILFSV